MDETQKQEIIDLMKEYNFKDSIEIGNSKTGSIKVYVDFDNEEEADKKVKSAIKVLNDNKGQILI